MSFHPENLEVGKKYIFRYIAWTGQIYMFVGTFLKLQVDSDSETLWLYFRHEQTEIEVPYDVGCIQQIMELQV